MFVAIAIIAIIFLVWYYWPRFTVRHLPTAPHANPFLGHLQIICQQGLSICSKIWKAQINVPLITCFKGRDPIVLLCDPKLAKQLLQQEKTRSLADLPFQAPATLPNTATGNTWKSLAMSLRPEMKRVSSEIDDYVVTHYARLRSILQQSSKESTSMNFYDIMRKFSIDVVFKAYLQFDLNLLEGNYETVFDDLVRNFQ